MNLRRIFSTSALAILSASLSFAGLPDLKPTALIAPSSGVAGKTIQVVYAVTNQGEAEAHGYWIDYVYATTNTDSAAASQMVAYGYSLPALPPGATYARTNTVTLPAGVTGDAYLILRVDATNGVPESNEENNALTTHISIAPPPPTPPCISYSPSAISKSVYAGQNASSNLLYIGNSGTGTLNYALNTDAAWLAMDPASGSVTGGLDRASGSNGTTPNRIQINYTTAGLATGSYTGLITITSAEATNSPQTVKVTLSVLPTPPGPTIAREPSLIARTAPKGQNLSSNIFYVWNSGTGTLNYALNTDARWMALDSAGGSSTGEHDRVQISYNTAELAAGAYTGLVTITSDDATNSPQTVKVTLSVLAPAIARDPSAFIRYVYAGQNMSSNNVFYVWNSGPGTLKYALSTDAAWMALDSAGGSSTGQHNRVQISYSTANLAAGSYTGLVNITSDAATNSPQSVKVTLRVMVPPPPPFIAFSPAYLYSDVYTGNNAQSQALYVWNGSTGTFNYALSTDATWLSVDPASGSSATSTGSSTGQSSRIQVNFATETLAAGSYTGHIAIVSADATNSPQSVRVTLRVVPPPPGPTIMRDPAAISRSAYAGQDMSNSIFYVWNGGTGTLNYALSTDTRWMSLDSTGGSSTGEHDRVQISYNTAGLAAGAYTGMVTITSGDATNSPQTVKVTLSVLRPPPGPTIAFSPSYLYSEVHTGSNAQSQALYVWNSGTGTMNYALTTDAAWLSVDPASGSSTGNTLNPSTGPSNKIQVNYATETLAVGSYTGLITITSTEATNSPQTVKVTMHVVPPPSGPTIMRDPAAITRYVYAGQDASNNVFYVWNSGMGTLNYTLGTDARWMSLDSAGGSSTGEHDRVQISYSTAGLAAGSYTGLVNITSDVATNSPQTVKVTLSVLRPPPGPTIIFSPPYLYSDVNVGSNAQSQVFYIWNGGTGTLNYALSTDAAWLSVTPTNGASASTGTSTSGQSSMIQVSFATETLPAGSYTGLIAIVSADATNSPQSVRVTLNVAPPPPPPYIVVKPPSLSSIVRMGSNAQSQVFYIWNGSTGTLNYALSTDTAWLSVTPTNGACTGQPDPAGSAGTRAQVGRAEVKFASATMATGTYTGTITITSAEASNSPLNVNVTLAVTAAPGTLPGIGPRITRVDILDQQMVRIEWESITNQSYTLMKASSIGAEYKVVTSGLNATPPLNAYYDTNPDGSIFYRVMVEP